MVKKRWKGLCALWIVLALVIGTFPVAGAVEDASESAAAAVSEDVENDKKQIPAEADRVESSSEEKLETSSSETEETELVEEESTGSTAENFVEGSAGKEGVAEGSAGKEGVAEDSAEKEGTAEGSAGKEGTAEGLAGKAGISEGLAEKEGTAEDSAEKEGIVESSAGKGGTAEGSAGKEGTAESSTKKEAAEGSGGKEGTAEGSAEKEEAVEDSAKDETWMAPGQSMESEIRDEETAETAPGKDEEEKESEKSEGENSSVKETSVEGASAEESSTEKSASEGDSKKEIPETTAPAFTVPELPERMALSAKAAAAREAATSAEVWLYVGSDEVSAGTLIFSGSNGNGKPGITIQFDKPFNSQSALSSITPPQDKKLSGWRLWGLSGSTESGSVGDSPLEELEITGQISADEYNRFIDSTKPDLFLLIEPLWRDARDIVDGDSLEMNIGDSCNLSEGTWQVSGGAADSDATDGDATVYTVDTGGRTVYAARNGTFIFRNNSAP